MVLFFYYYREGQPVGGSLMATSVPGVGILAKSRTEGRFARITALWFPTDDRICPIILEEPL